MMDPAECLLVEIKELANTFVKANFVDPSPETVLMVENAMLQASALTSLYIEHRMLKDEIKK